VGSETCRVEISSLSSNALKKCASNTLSLMLGVHKNHVDVSVLIDIGKPDYFIARSGDETISFEHVEVPLSSASLPRLGPSPDLLWRVVSRSDPCDRCRKDLQRDRSVVSLVRADAWVVRSCAHTGSVAKIVKLEHAWRRLDGRNDDGFQVAPFPGGGGPAGGGLVVPVTEPSSRP